MNFDLPLSSERQAIYIHYQTQVQMEHDAGRKENEARPWQVDVDHSTAKYEDGDSVVITATVTSKAINCFLHTKLN
jgi:hypothetical protein